MSQYCEASDVKALGVSDEDKLKWAIRASGRADGYLALRYQLPLVAWGDDLRDHVRAVARYLALDDRGWKPDNPADETVVKNHDDAIRWLEKVSTKDIQPQGIVDSSPQIIEAAPLVATAKPLGWSWGRPLEDV